MHANQFHQSLGLLYPIVPAVSPIEEPEINWADASIESDLPLVPNFVALQVRYLEKRRALLDGLASIRRLIDQSEELRFREEFPKLQLRMRVQRIVPGKWVRRFRFLFSRRIERFRTASLVLAAAAFYHGMDPDDIAKVLFQFWPWRLRRRK